MTVHALGLATIADLFKQSVKEGDIGVELEIEGKNLPTEVSGWTVKPENSLRGEAFEYVTSSPVPFGQLGKRLDAVCRIMRREGTQVIPSPRMSTHIHINMQQRTLQQCLGFYMFWMIIEPLMLKICGEERNGNVFCLPSYDVGDTASHFTRLCNSIIVYNNVMDWPKRGKYQALNMDALCAFGSYEARCFPLSVNKDQLYQWCQWLMNIRTTIDNWSPEDPTYKSLYDWFLKEPHAAVEQIFTGIDAAALAAPFNLTDLISLGAEFSYEVHRACTPFLVFDAEKMKPQRKPKRFASLAGSVADWISEANEGQIPPPNNQPDLVEVEVPNGD